MPQCIFRCNILTVGINTPLQSHFYSIVEFFCIFQYQTLNSRSECAMTCFSGSQLHQAPPQWSHARVNKQHIILTVYNDHFPIRPSSVTLKPLKHIYQSKWVLIGKLSEGRHHHECVYCGVFNADCISLVYLEVEALTPHCARPEWRRTSWCHL